MILGSMSKEVESEEGKRESGVAAGVGVGWRVANSVISCEVGRIALRISPQNYNYRASLVAQW